MIIKKCKFCLSAYRKQLSYSYTLYNMCYVLTRYKDIEYQK